MSDRFHVTYLLTLTADEDPEERIRALQLEQSAELPDGVVRALGMQEVTGTVTAVPLAGSGSGAGSATVAGAGSAAGANSGAGPGVGSGAEAGVGGGSAAKSGSGAGPRQIQVTIGWPKNNHGNEITQFLNVLFGNISMKRGIAITGIQWKDVAGVSTTTGGDGTSDRDVSTHGETAYRNDTASGGYVTTRDEPSNSGRGGLLAGPAIGVDRLREKWGIHGRALACTALKPMGYSSEKLADLAFRFAMGGVDIIKDDHGLANQPTAPFAERVRLCVEAVDRAAQKTGRRSRYFPNITTDPHRVQERFEQAANMGADGVLLIPMLVGPALMHHLARLGTGLPIMAHPAFSGTYIAHDAAAFRAMPETGATGMVRDENPETSSNQPLLDHDVPSASAPSLHGFEPGLFYGGLMRALGADFTIYPNTGGRFSFTREVCDGINNHARNEDLPFAPCFPAPGGGMQRDRMAYWLENYGADTTFLMGGSLFEDPAGIEAASRAFMESLGA